MAILTLTSIAKQDGPELPVYTRIAEHGGNLYLDLGDKAWRAVEITPAGWRVIAEPPVKFRRSPGNLPLPEPLGGGCLSGLWRFANVADEGDRVLVLGWLVSAFRPMGPYPVLGLAGTQGSAKTTTSKVICRVIDPNVAQLRTMPSDERDLVIAAKNHWVVAFDNLSGISPELSDGLCRLATGGGLGTRKLYTNDEESLFDVQRPVMGNGIDEFATRSDLLDRSILIQLPEVAEGGYRTERQFWAEFEEAQPRILGALLDAVSTALRRVDTVEVEGTYRMADFVEWVVAAEPALGVSEGTFLHAYAENRADANEVALEGSPVVEPLKQLLRANRGTWSGSATELLEALKTQRAAPVNLSSARGWPQKPRVLSSVLRLLKPNLEKIGFELDLDSRDPVTRVKRIHIRYEQGEAGPLTGGDSDNLIDTLTV